ncbi:MAG: carboxypeptidase-like regulatory domain-containing protein [Sphingobacterium sp.]|nr:carboxypeptidase-like regulatory domain-containing protein [Sphingobacterium sp.]
MQKEVKGIVVKEDGKPLTGVTISSTGTLDNTSGAVTGEDGRFSLRSVQKDATLLVFCNGYKKITLKPDFTRR